MRASIFFFLIILILGLFLWINLSGALLILGLSLLLIFFMITAIYADALLLYLLAARQIRPSDHNSYFEAASQEAYKLQLPTPSLYFYHGTLERAFVLQRGKSISLIINRDLLNRCSSTELHAICFELLLQVKRGLAAKRTRTMFILGLFIWFTHSVVGIFSALVPFANLRRSIDWFLNTLLNPTIGFIFKMILGKRYFRKLERCLSDFPKEKETLEHLGLKVGRPGFYYSLPSQKIMELNSTARSKHYQSILALEFLPHEWDYFFSGEELKRAE